LETNLRLRNCVDSVLSGDIQKTTYWHAGTLILNNYLKHPASASLLIWELHSEALLRISTGYRAGEADKELLMLLTLENPVGLRKKCY